MWSCFLTDAELHRLTLFNEPSLELLCGVGVIYARESLRTLGFICCSNGIAGNCVFNEIHIKCYAVIVDTLVEMIVLPLGI